MQIALVVCYLMCLTFCACRSAQPDVNSDRVHQEALVNRSVTFLKLAGREIASTNRTHVWVYGTLEGVKLYCVYLSGLPLFLEPFKTNVAQLGHR
jgi:hypothetical protein